MPNLRVSSDGHHLERVSDGSPFLLLSDTQWLLNAYSDAKVLAILDDRAAKGFTAVQVFATHGFADSPTRTDNAGRLPFVGNDPTQLNAAYWQRWRWICDQAAARGLQFILVMGEPGRFGDGSVPWRFSGNTVAEHQRAYHYARQVGAHFATAPNVVFAQGQDSQANGSLMPGLGYCFNAAGWRAMAKGAADGVNGVDNYTGTTDYTTTLMTYHGLEKWSGGYKDDISLFFQNDAWIDFYGPEIFHDNGFVYEIVNRDYGLPAPVKPSFAMEGSYEDGIYEGQLIVPSYLRIEAWNSLLGGVCGYAYGHCLNWQQTNSIAHLDAAGASQMGALARFANQHAWWRWVPDGGLITANAGSGATRKVGVRSSAGDECLVYYPNNAVATIRNVLAVPTTATWFDPRNGNMVGAGVFEAGESRALTPPAGWEDGVLFLVDSARTVATPAFAPNGGLSTAAVDVQVSCATVAAEIRYTLDGSDPTAASPLAGATVRIEASATLKAKAFKTGLGDSYTASADFVVAGTEGTVIADEFDDGALSANPNGAGSGWNAKSYNAAPLPTESGGAFNASMGTENGIGAIMGKDVFTLWDDDGATVSWVIKDMTVQTPHAYNCYLAYCAELGIISANADRSGSEWVMSGPNRKGGFYISVGKKNNTNAVELWIAVSNKSYTGVEGTSGFLRPTQTSTAPGGLGVVFNATFPLTVTATLTRNGWRVTTSQAGFTPLAGNWTTDLIRTGNNASISDEFANGVFLFTAGRNHGIDGSGDSYTPNSGRIEKVTVVRNAGVIGGIELLANTGFEADAAGWAANGGSIARTTAQMHGGVAACRSYNRTAAWAGPRQVVKNALLANGPGNYAVGAWLRLASGGDTGRIQVGVKVAGVWTWFSAEGTVPSGGWGQVVGTVPVTWTGTLEDAWFVVNTTTSTAELYVDDCSLQTAVETPPPVDGLENGSFEDGVADWTVTAPNGGTPACAVLDIQGASDGSHAMAFGNANAASNAVLSQSVGTVADTVYALRFDYGAFGASGKPQRLRVEALDGTTVLASAEVVALGPGNFVAASTTFAARTLAIAATSASTTIRFTDVTAPTDSITCDGMLDNVELVAVDPALAALRQAYVDQQFGMFLHYGMGTYTGEEWASPNRPINTFAPTALDTDQWAAAAKSAGMRYGILTTKHHDGFALWDSSRSVYDVAGTSWFAAQPSGQGDIVRRYADSFRAQGLKVGFYYSIWDRSNGIDGSTLTSRQATDYVKAELTELLTNYGPIHAIWTDGWGWKNWHGYVLYQEVYDHVKALSPSTLLVENNHTAVNTDIRTYEQTPLPPEGNTFPSELCATIRSDGKWFWSAGADATKSVETLREQRSTANARNAAYLLDVTPDPRGLVPDSQRNGLVLLQDGPDEAPAAIMGFHYDSSSGIAEITIQGAANTTYRCVACGDIGFGETAGTVSLWQADAASDSGTVGPDGTTVTADADGNATVRLTLGQEPRRFLRVETVP